MSEENVEVVRRMYDARDRGDTAGTLARFHPRVVVDATARGDTAVGQGHEELVAIIAEWTSEFEEWGEEIDEIRDLGDNVFVVATQRGRGRGSGVEVEARYALLYEVEEGKITRMTLFREAADALEAARLSE
jgi:ketosteroid isomerase-like protein